MQAARKSSATFTALVFGYDNAPLHIRMHDHVESQKHTGFSTHRGGGKTDQISIGRMAWEIGHDTNIRIKVFKNTADEARKIPDSMRRIIESNRYRAVFPDVRPDPDHWTGSSFRVQRSKTGEKEPTVASFGVFGTFTGGRSDLILLDDIVDIKNAVQNPALRDKVKEVYRNAIIPTLVPGGRTMRVYTPYHVADISVDWEKNPNIATTYEAVNNYISPWPEMWTPEVLRDVEMDIGTIAYARAYSLKRISDEDILVKEAWLDDAMYVDSIPLTSGRWIASIDFAFTKKRLGGIPNASKDPDYTVCFTALVDRTGNAYVDKVYRKRATWPETKDFIVPMCEHCEVLLAEDVAAQRALIDDLNRSTVLNCRAMTPAEGISGTGGGGSYDKRGRLAACSAQIESGKLHLRGVMQGGEIIVCKEHEPLYDELTTFPVGEHDDAVDAVTQMMRWIKKRMITGRDQRHGEKDKTRDPAAPSTRLGSHFPTTHSQETPTW